VTRYRVIQVVLIAMLLWALVPSNPYGYYQLLRWACVVGLAYLAVESRRTPGWVWVFGALAVLYNPVVPFALGRDLWEVANVPTVVVLATAACRRVPAAQAPDSLPEPQINRGTNPPLRSEPTLPGGEPQPPPGPHKPGALADSRRPRRKKRAQGAFHGDRVHARDRHTFPPANQP